MLRFTAPQSRGRVIAWSLLLAIPAALGLTRWIEASDHKDSALLAADHAADIADVYTFKSPVNPDNVVLVMTVSGFIPPSEASTTFFDLVQFKKLIAGEATAFRNPGVDTFAGFNVLAIVAEVPSSLLGGQKLGVWGTTSRVQF